jgi:GNAT superfamily N-acetyltransferase
LFAELTLCFGAAAVALCYGAFDRRISDNLAITEMTQKGEGMLIRDANHEDRAAWQRLWEGYNRFYETSVEPEVTSHTWRRILDPAFPLAGRVADRNGLLVGLTVSVLHQGTWTIEPILYLEDLFVDPAARGGGVGRALMEDVIALSKTLGCSQVYWHTRAENIAARRLYDAFVHADDFVRYRMTLKEPRT